MTSTLTRILAVMVLLLGLGACSSTSSTSADAEPSSPAADTVVLDVRTAEEYDAGHLEGARLLDVTSGELQEALPDLDPGATYLIYCRSGNRASQAATLMEEAGFTDVTSLGSLDDASKATGLSVTR